MVFGTLRDIFLNLNLSAVGKKPVLPHKCNSDIRCFWYHDIEFDTNIRPLFRQKALV